MEVEPYPSSIDLENAAWHDAKAEIESLDHELTIMINSKQEDQFSCGLSLSSSEARELAGILLAAAQKRDEQSEHHQWKLNQS